MMALEIAEALHVVVEKLKLGVVDEGRNISDVREIQERGEERRRSSPRPTSGGHLGQSRPGQCAADAVADEVDILFSGRLLDGVDRDQWAFAEVVFERLCRELRPRVDP